MAKPLSERLMDLSTRAKEAEQAVESARGEGKSKIEQREKQIRSDAARRKQALDKQASAAQSEIASTWSGITAKVQSDVDHLRGKIDVKMNQLDAEMAERAAEDAEESAMRSIDFALDAIDTAETAVLDATLARATANTY